MDVRFLHVVIVRDVENSKQVYEQILNSTEWTDVAVLNGKLIYSLFQIKVAACAALIKQDNNNLTTNGLASELIYELASVKHVNEAYRRHGIGKDSSLLVIGFFDTTAALRAKLLSTINGKVVDIGAFEHWYEEILSKEEQTILRKNYKLGPSEDIESGILTRMAVKAFSK